MIFSKTMILAYMLLGLAAIGIFEVFHMRYFSDVLTAHSAGLDPTNPELRDAMKEAVFGHGGEVSREVPWTLFISNYMYMIYTGSGVIFLVALAELLNINVIAKAAAGFMTAGLVMVFAGLFTIATDLNLLGMLWMFITPNITAGMWLMLPLYSVYIPFVLLEIYLILTNKRELAKKVALPVLFLSVGIDVVEYYIQGKLFSMNTARQLWTEFPSLTFYFIVSAFVSSLGVMGLYTYISYRAKTEYTEMMDLIRRTMLFFICLLGLYEVVGYLTVDSAWSSLILYGPFSGLYFGGYIMLTLALPFLLTVRKTGSFSTLVASILVIVGGFIGRYIFVYGGNANPMTNRFGMGFEKYDFYGEASSFNYLTPHLGEILIVVASGDRIVATCESAVCVP